MYIYDCYCLRIYYPLFIACILGHNIAYDLAVFPNSFVKLSSQALVVSVNP